MHSGKSIGKGIDHVSFVKPKEEFRLYLNVMEAFEDF